MPKPSTSAIPTIAAFGLAVVLATAVLAPAAASVGSNGLTNGGAEDGDSGPAGWSSVGFTAPDARFTWDRTVRHAGARSLAIDTGPVANDVRWSQTVTVPAGSTDHRYRLSGWIKTEGVSGGYGASLGNESNFDRTAGISGTTDWTYVTTELRVPAGSQLHIAARLGHFTQLSTGRAWFDDIELADPDASPATPAPATSAPAAPAPAPAAPALVPAAPAPAAASAPSTRTIGKLASKGHFATARGRVSAVRHHTHRPRNGHPTAASRCHRSSHR